MIHAVLFVRAVRAQAADVLVGIARRLHPDRLYVARSSDGLRWHADSWTVADPATGVPLARIEPGSISHRPQLRSDQADDGRIA